MLPPVVWSGSSYLLTWSNSSGIVAQRFSQTGAALDASPFPVMEGFGRSTSPPSALTF